MTSDTIPLMLLLVMLFAALLVLQQSGQSATTSVSVKRLLGDGRLLALESEVRDGNLNALAKLINSHSTLFTNWTESQQDRAAFMGMLSNWIVAPPCGLPPIERVIHRRTVNCARKRYSGALTGKHLNTPRLIVDFILFGYDVDKLEIRFHETYNLVDVFVILETPCTMRHYPKPRLLPTLWKDPRFIPFLDKIYEIQIGMDKIPPMLGLKIEKWFRREIVTRFFSLKSVHNPLIAKIISTLILHGNSTLNSSYPIGLQNDGDEIINYSAMAHVKQCELKPEIEGLQFPAYSYKKNFHWFQGMHDMHCLQGSSFNSNISKILKSYLWSLGPFSWPLYKMQKAGDLLRIFENLPNSYCKQNMGLGAAIHMSSGAEPAEVWMKRVGTLDGIGIRLQPAFLQAAAAGIVTPELIFLETMYPSCITGKYGFQDYHISSMGNQVAAKVYRHLPQVVRKYPERYPFLLPGHPANAKRFKLILQTSQAKWKTNMCSLPSAEALLLTSSGRRQYLAELIKAYSKIQ